MFLKSNFSSTFLVVFHDITALDISGLSRLLLYNAPLLLRNLVWDSTIFQGDTLMLNQSRDRLFLIVKPVLERRGQVHPGRNRTLEQLLPPQIWKLRFFGSLGGFIWKTLQKPRRPHSPRQSWHRRRIPNAPWSAFARTPDEEEGWKDMMVSDLQKLRLSSDNTSTNGEQQVVQLFFLTWAPFINGSTLSGRSFSSRDFTLQLMMMILMRMLGFYFHHSSFSFLSS